MSVAEAFCVLRIFSFKRWLECYFGSVCFLGDLTISSKKFRQSKEEEFSICHPSKCSSELFDFRVKSFSGCIGQSLIKEVQYSFIVVGKSLDDGIKLWIFLFLNLVEP